MAKVRISKQAIDKAIQAAELLGSALMLYDDSLTGFGFRAAKRGGGSYFIEYRIASRGLTKQRFILGKHGPLTPTSARTLAQDLLGQVARGIDIQAAKEGERARAKGMTFGELITSYIDFRDDGSQYWHKVRLIYRNDVPGVLKARAASLITRADLRRMLDKTRERSLNVERWLYTPLSGIFKWAIERGIVTANPAEGLRPPEPGIRRDRVLSKAEFAEILQKVDLNLPSPWRECFQLLALTGCRRDEIARMRWDEVDLEKGFLNLPASRTKNKNAHALELSPQAVAILAAIPRSPCGFVLTTYGRAPVQNFGKVKLRLDALLEGVAPWRIHDIRRSFATHAAEYLAIDEGIIERLLNHIQGRGGVAGIYQRAQYREKRRAAMDAWGRYVEELRGRGA
jgi:integrase